MRENLLYWPSDECDETYRFYPIERSLTMNSQTRRDFLKASVTASTALAHPTLFVHFVPCLEADKRATLPLVENVQQFVSRY